MMELIASTCGPQAKDSFTAINILYLSPTIAISKATVKSTHRDEQYMRINQHIHTMSFNKTNMYEYNRKIEQEQKNKRNTGRR